MGEVSIILKESIDIPIQEYRALTRCSYPGHIWMVIHRPSPVISYKLTWFGVEYIFGLEDFTAFRLVSNNILLQWETMATMNLQKGEEFQIQESIFLRHYSN